MRVVFRTDSSTLAGMGHLVRCLTLAEALSEGGARVEFICRALPGHASVAVEEKGFRLHLLPPTPPVESRQSAGTEPLAVDWQQDAEAVASISRWDPSPPAWLVVDHYGIGEAWEKRLRPEVKRIMVIDDLANRTHDCDLLLDQNLGRTAGDYVTRVPPSCRLLMGPRFAILRRQFAAARARALGRRGQAVQRILVAMGGTDLENITGLVLRGIEASGVAAQVDVVLGRTSPHAGAVRGQIDRLPIPASLHVGVEDMADLMADADVAIGAAGTTSWERCCLGLPSIVVILADNQFRVATGLAQVGAATVLGWAQTLKQEDIASAVLELAESSGGRREMSAAAAEICDGLGVDRVCARVACEAERCDT